MLLIAVIAAGGALGALARYAVESAFPHPVTGLPTATLLINVTGCALIGALMVLFADVWAAHRLVRPFLGTGVLGGFTTFSTYVVEAQRLIALGRPRLALVYLIGTAVAALIAVQLGVTATRLVTRRAISRRRSGR